MTNPTTPFSWQMPTASDLVTDLPADFETFGQAVATSMADLLGGTTGQVLSKASNTDMDFTWVAQDDSNAIQNAIVDAKGDLIGATAADTPARLAVGTNGQVLTADSTAATGIKWATPASNGLTLISRTSFSNVATQNFDGVFTSTYQNYLVVFDRFLVNTNGASAFIKIRTGGTTVSNGYFGAMCGADYLGTSKILGTNNGAGFQLHQQFSLNGDQNLIELNFTLDATANEQIRYMARIYSAYDAVSSAGGGGRSSTSTCDGFQIYAGSGNVSGTVSIYGLAKA